jgi:hypothetical protein
VESDLNAVLDKLVKLQTLHERASTPGEAAAAAAAVQRLLFKNNLDMARVYAAKSKADGEAHGGPVFNRITITFGAKTAWIVKWKAALLNGIAMNNFCRVIWTHKRDGCYLLGAQENITVVTGMFDYLSSAISRLQKEAIKDPEAKYFCYSESKRRNWIESFNSGAVSTVIDRLEQQRREDAAKYVSEKGLVVMMDEAVEDYLAQQFPNARASRQSKKRVSQHGLMAGIEAGNSISLSKQLGG